MNLRQLRIIFYAGERALTYWSKAALLTGEGTGFGKSVAFALLRDGYFVAVAGRRNDVLDAVAGSTWATPTRDGAP